MPASEEAQFDLVAWIELKFREFNDSSQIKTMAPPERSEAYAQILVEGLLQLDEPMRTDVAARLLARCEEYREGHD